MVKKYALMVLENGKTVDICFKKNKDDNLIDYVQALLNVSSPSEILQASSQNCTIYYTDGKQAGKTNKVASLLGSCTIQGSALVVENVESEDSKNADSKSAANSTNFLKSVKAQAASAMRTKQANGIPKKPKRAYDFFAKEHQQPQTRGESNKMSFMERNRLTRDAWNQLSEDEKTIFNDKAQADKLRYQTELTYYKKMNPDHPKRARNAYNFWVQTCKKQGLDVRANEWKTMSAEGRSKFVDMANDDAERYTNELKSYKLWCSDNNIDYENVSRKKRKLTSSA